MGKRLVQQEQGAASLATPGLDRAPQMDLMCSHFVLTLALGVGMGRMVRSELAGILAIAGRHLLWPQAVLQRVRGFLARRCVDNRLWQRHASLNDEHFLQRHGQWRGPYEEDTLFHYLEEYGKQHPADLVALLHTTREGLAQRLNGHKSVLERNVVLLAELLQLNRGERALLLFGTLARYQRDLRSLMVEFKVGNAHEAHALLAEVAGVDPVEVAGALRSGSRLERTGLIDNLIAEHNITDLADLMKVSERLPQVLLREYASREELMAVFTRPSGRSALGMRDFAFVEEDARLLSGLLRNAAQRKIAGVNVLLYGPPGTGKTALAKVAAQEAGLELFEVEYADRDGNSLSGRDRYRSLQVAQIFLGGTPSAALLFDEVEDVFPPLTAEAAHLLAKAEQGGAVAATGVNGKAWVNQVLESNPVPTIWVTNRIEQIDPAIRRRFAYHLELKSPPPGAREQLVRNAVEGVAVSEGFVGRLMMRKGLTPAQIHNAVRFASLACTGSGARGQRRSPPPPADRELERLIERQLRNADHALGRPSGDAAGMEPPARYDLDMINLESRYDIRRVVEALKARGHGTMCFYGAPGTGKTALGEHVARTLGRTLMVRRASDLMSKFIGETEQNMADMFVEAEREGAVLLLDEADSFLQDRRGAQRSYEVTEVNEMLQGMERFRGIFICTTNQMERIDEAALRRFTFKIRFLPLTAAQRERLFVAQALGERPRRLTRTMKQRLQDMDQLSLGDFAAVRKQAEILGQALPPGEFLAQLEAEHRIKPQVREARRVGFL